MSWPSFCSLIQDCTAGASQTSPSSDMAEWRVLAYHGRRQRTSAVRLACSRAGCGARLRSCTALLETYRVAGAYCYAPAPSEPDLTFSRHPAQALSTL